jgi:HAE1 family hydrophobic/amphiphilic exporter-1
VNVELLNANIRDERDLMSVFEIEDKILEWFSSLESQGLSVEIGTQQNGPPTWAAVWIKLNAKSASDIGTLKEVSDDFKLFLQWVEGAKNVSTSSSDNPWQFVFRFDQNKLAFSGLTPDDILGELRIYFSWINASSLNSVYEENDIVLSVEEFDSMVSPQDIENLQITTRIWKVRVGDYASYAFVPALSSINRLDEKINISVESEVENGFLPTDIQPKFVEFAKSYNYPEWISFTSWGESSENADLIFATVQSFFISIFLIFTILVFQFNSYSQPIMILYSVVLALLWVNIGLFLTGNPYSLTFWIWFIALTWVVVNDAIILVDRINRNLDRLNNNFKRGTLTKADYVESLVAAWKSRLQPIIVTTITTVLWVLPLALQDAFWAWLWFTIIFWLIAGSFMTLFVVPSFYYTIYLNKKMREGLEKNS